MRRDGLWSLALLIGLWALPTGASAEVPSSTATGQATAEDDATKKSVKRSKKASRTRTAKKARTRSKKTTIPVDVAVGPAFHWITGPIQDDQAPHYGLKLSVKAIIDQATIKANKGRIPKKYRAMASKVQEARISPSIFIPDTLFISPKTENVGMYGVNFRPFAFNLPLLRKPRLAVGVGLDLSYIYIDGEDAGLGTTHFVRPGLDLAADLEIPLSKTFLVSLGWQSIFYPPQELGGDVFALGELDASIWHIGQAYLLLHFRFPYSVAL